MRGRESRERGGQERSNPAGDWFLHRGSPVARSSHSS
jgi:hypothetical protein